MLPRVQKVTVVTVRLHCGLHLFSIPNYLIISKGYSSYSFFSNQRFNLYFKLKKHNNIAKNIGSSPPSPQNIKVNL